MLLPSSFLKLSSIYAAAGFRLFLIGGTSRDLLLGRNPEDLDFVTDATPEEESRFLKDFSSAFARFGTLKVTFDGKQIDVATMREEGEYLDHRHPSFLRFVRDPSADAKRRDFTVNALYIDSGGEILDYFGGLSDLENKVLRFIGDPLKRIQEDPLRILRAERFAKRLGFELDPASQKAIEDHRDLLQYLNPNKIEMEMKKE